MEDEDLAPHLLSSLFELAHVFLKSSFTVILVRFGEGGALNICVNPTILQWKFSQTFFSKEVIMKIVDFNVSFLYAQGFLGIFSMDIEN